MTEPDPRDRAQSGSDPQDESMNFTEWAQSRAPQLSEVSNSNPNAKLLRHNLVAMTDDPKAARTIALDFERAADDNFDTTMLVLGHPESRESKHKADPEGVTAHAAKRSLIGGVPGAVIGALVIGLGSFLLTKSGVAAVGGAIGGAIFGFFVAAVVSFVIGTGQSETYQQSFIDPDAADSIMVAIHSDDPAVIDSARKAVKEDDRIQLFDVDARGELRPTQ